MLDTIAESQVNVNEEGYLTDLNEWNRDIALAIAEKEGVTMTEKNWEIVNWIQEQHRNGISLSIRKVGKSGVTDIKEFYRLFPDGPLKKASKIAGIPKPASCI